METNITASSTSSVSLINYIGTVLCALEVLENVMVIVLIFTRKSLCENPHIYFVLFMSLSDTLLGCGLIFGFCMTIHAQGRYINTAFCVTTNVIIFIALLTSCGQTFLICLERFVATCTRPSSQVFSRRRRKVYVLANWIMGSFLILTLFIAVPPDVQYVPICNLHNAYKRENMSTISLTISTYFLVVVVFVIGMYIATACRLSNRLNSTNPVKSTRRHSEVNSRNPKIFTVEEPSISHVRERQCTKYSFGNLRKTVPVDKSCVLLRKNNIGDEDKLDNTLSTEVVSESLTAQKKHVEAKNVKISYHKQMVQRAFYTVSVIIATFIISILPSVFFHMISAFADPPYYVAVICYLLAFLNSVLNPIIYAWRLRQFRESITCCLKFC